MVQNQRKSHMRLPINSNHPHLQRWIKKECHPHHPHQPSLNSRISQICIHSISNLLVEKCWWGSSFRSLGRNHIWIHQLRRRRNKINQSHQRIKKRTIIYLRKDSLRKHHHLWSGSLRCEEFSHRTRSDRGMQLLRHNSTVPNWDV